LHKFVILEISTTCVPYLLAYIL